MQKFSKDFGFDFLSVLNVNDSEVLFGSYLGLFSFNKQNYILKRTAIGSLNNSRIMVSHIMFDKSGYVWASLRDKLVKLKLENGYQVEAIIPIDSINSPITSFCFDEYNNIYITTLRDGLIFYDQKLKKQASYKLKLSSSYHICLSDIICAKDNRIYVASQGNGLLHFDRATKKFEYISQREDIVFGQILNSLKEINNCIWFPTRDNGLGKYELGTKKISYLTTQDGLPSMGIEKVVIDHNETIWGIGDIGIVLY